MSFKIDGFDELEKQLKKIEDSVNEHAGTTEVGFDELFNPSFMKSYTDFNNMDEFFDKSPFEVETNEDFEKLDESELDLYVDKITRFSSWEEMLHKAGELYYAKKLGF